MSRSNDGGHPGKSGRAGTTASATSLLLTIADVVAELERAGMPIDHRDGENGVASLCPVCTRPMVWVEGWVDWVCDCGPPGKSCEHGCTPSRIADEIYARAERSWNGAPPVALAQEDRTDAYLRLKATPADQIPPEHVRWLWQGWVPLGMLTLMVGTPGVGKSTLGLQLAADVTRGKLEGALAQEPADVLVASLEDPIAARLAPIAMAANADLARLHFVECEDRFGVINITEHLPEFERLARERRARLLMIDPLSASLPQKMSSHVDKDVRGALAPLVSLAERHDLAVVCTVHFNKGAVDALLGVGGSIAFAAAARSLLVVGSHPDNDRGDEDPRRVLAHRKCNVGKRQRSREWFIQPREWQDEKGRPLEATYAMLGDECDVSADELVRPRPVTMSPRVLAERFLRHLLADGPTKASEVYDLASDEGIAKRTLDRAKKDLSVRSFKKDGVWWWEVPEEEDELPPDEPPDEPEAMF
jgi:hypothetical protein